LKRLDRYVLKELAVPLLVGTVIIAMLFVANEFIRIFKDFNLQYFPPISIVQLVLYRLPQWLILTLPVGTAIGAALAMSRLARESELTAMRAAGIPVRRMLWPIFLAGLGMSIANLAIVELVQPQASMQYRKLAGDLALLSYAPTMQENAIFKLEKYLVSFQHMERDGENKMRLEDVLLIERQGLGELTVYRADKGTYVDGVWTFPQARMTHLQGDTVVNVSTASEFVINEPIRIQDMFRTPEPEETTAVELWKTIVDKQKLGQIPRADLVAFHVKFAVPASCIIFALTSALMAMWVARSGPFVGLLLSLVLVLLYYNAYVICTQIIGKMGIVDPWLAAWLPNFAYIILALVALRRVR
jgi:lipopolysaccharide export system permease protein